jgi:hypothetical protein
MIGIAFPTCNGLQIADFYLHHLNTRGRCIKTHKGFSCEKSEGLGEGFKKGWVTCSGVIKKIATRGLQPSKNQLQISPMIREIDILIHIVF